MSVRSNKVNAANTSEGHPVKLKVASSKGGNSSANTKLSSSTRGVSPIYPNKSATVELSIKNKSMPPDQQFGYANQNSTPISGNENPHRVAFNPLNVHNSSHNNVPKNNTAPKVRTRTPNTQSDPKAGNSLNGNTTPSAA